MRIEDFLLTYVNKWLTGRILHCFSKGIHLYIECTQSHRIEEAIPDS